MYNYFSRELDGIAKSGYNGERYGIEWEASEMGSVAYTGGGGKGHLRLMRPTIWLAASAAGRHARARARTSARPHPHPFLLHSPSTYSSYSPILLSLSDHTFAFRLSLLCISANTYIIFDAKRIIEASNSKQSLFSLLDFLSSVSISNLSIRSPEKSHDEWDV